LSGDPLLPWSLASFPGPDRCASSGCLIFAQLHNAFPGVEDIDRAEIAKAMGVSGDDWSKHMLPSGRSFDKALAYTIGWLNAEDYIKAYGTHPA
jgi:hypothetical protein